MIEKFWNLLGGRKFLGFIIATWLLIAKSITGEIWLTVFFIYAASNLAAEYLRSKSGKDVS
jgi:hypothetical protein